MRNVILLGLFVIVGIATIAYEVIVIRAPMVKEKERQEALAAAVKKDIVELEGGYRPTPLEQVYDVIQESVDLASRKISSPVSVAGVASEAIGKEDGDFGWENDVDRLPEEEKKIAKAILRFREKLSAISKKDLDDERRRLDDALAKARAFKVSEPRKEDFIDEYGNLWVKKTYEGGIVRYDFPEAVQ